MGSIYRVSTGEYIDLSQIAVIGNPRLYSKEEVWFEIPLTFSLGGQAIIRVEHMVQATDIRYEILLAWEQWKQQEAKSDYLLKIQTAGIAAAEMA